MQYSTFIEKMQMEGSVSEFSANIQLGNEQVHRCRLSAVSFEINQTQNMLLSVADVTQQEQMREALERKQKVETIGILAGGIAHDFNNILAVILGHIGLAKMRVVDVHARAPLDKAEQACLRAREMTRQLLAFSRGGKPVIGSCDTRQLIIDSAMLAVSDTSVACLFDIEKTIWPLMVDKIQVGQVIANLIANAVDAMNKSGIIEISARNYDLTGTIARKRPTGTDSKPIAGGPWVEIKIKDQGPGIPDSIRSKIFDPFFTTKEKGTGLGLAIVFSVIQNHGSAINVMSSPGEGTVFTICLPADQGSAVRLSAPDLSVLSAKKKVLLMDDDAHVRETAREILSSFGYELIETENGTDAIRAYTEAQKSGNPFDFCILDLIIPGGMSGSDCAKEIHKINPSALLLVSSGYSNDPVLSKPKDYGFSGVISKPYTYEEFRQVLANVLVL
jgi:signal transduction histidine kinase/ActR/RegA family two-component response regulator